MNVIKFFPCHARSCHLESYHKSNVNPYVNPKTKHDCHEMPMRCPMRHIYTPVNQTINGIYIQCNIWLNENNSIPSTVCAKNNHVKQLKFSLIVGNKFNPIACRNHVHLGTKIAILIAYFIETNQQSDSFPLLTIKKRNKVKSTQQCFSIEYNFL